MENNELIAQGVSVEPLEMASESEVRVSCVSVPTALYRHWGADRKLLYVGISLSPTYRLGQHKDGSHWFPKIKDVSIEWFPDRISAMDAERKAIKEERPEFNVVHRTGAETRSVRLQALVEESTAELTRRVTRYSPTYTIREAASALNMSSSWVRLAIEAGDIPHFMAGKKAVITGWALIEYLEALQAGVVVVRRNVRAAA